jgi:hypothetical protein
MNPQDEARDAFTDAYRKASADEAGRPSAAVRNAILAEATAASRRRAPAANDSRYLWRGVAGVAVLGFALLLWQQVDHQLPGDAPKVAVATVDFESNTDFESNKMETTAPVTENVVGASAESPASPSPPQRAAAADSTAVDSTADAAATNRAQEQLMAQESAPAFAPAPATAAPAVSGATVESRASAPERNELARAATKMSATADAETDDDALLRLHFPRQYQSNTPHRLWLVQDGAGALLRSGELAPDIDHAELRLEIERELGGRLLRPWRIRTLRNAQGQSIEFAIAQAP